MKELSKVKVEKLNLEDLMRLFVRAQERMRKDGVGLRFTIETYPVDRPGPRKMVERS